MKSRKTCVFKVAMNMKNQFDVYTKINFCRKGKQMEKGEEYWIKSFSIKTPLA
jgi:hypothetical protein